MRFAGRRFQREEWELSGRECYYSRLVALTAFREAPGGIAAVDARVIKADAIARRIAQVGFAPQPGLISRAQFETETRPHEPPDGGVQIIELEVHDDAACVRRSERSVQRKCRRTDWAREPRVVRRIVDDEAEAEQLVEGN